MEARMHEQDDFNREADDAIYDEHGVPRDLDAYPDSEEAKAVLARMAEAEGLGVDPATLDLLDSGDLGL